MYVYMCVCVWVCIFMYKCVYVCVFEYVYMCYEYVSVCICMCIWMCICVCMSVYVIMWVCMPVSVCVCDCVYVCVCIHVHTKGLGWVVSWKKSNYKVNIMGKKQWRKEDREQWPPTSSQESLTFSSINESLLVCWSELITPPITRFLLFSSTFWNNKVISQSSRLWAALQLAQEGMLPHSHYTRVT